MGKPRSIYKPKKSAKFLRNCLVCLIGLMVIIVCVAIAINYSKKDNRSQGESETIITYSTDTPDESQQNARNYNWRGSGDEPKKIRISKISIDSFVQKIGVDQHGKVAVPNNVHLAGWFADSVKPSQRGLSIIDGHVSGRKEQGVFKRIGELEMNDEFEIELGDGSIKNYKVLEIKQVKESDAAAVLFNQNPKVASQLNLITCGGNFDTKTNQYEDRVIVSAELVY